MNYTNIITPFVLAQIIGFVALVITILSFQKQNHMTLLKYQKKKKSILDINYKKSI